MEASRHLGQRSDTNLDHSTGNPARLVCLALQPGTQNAVCFKGLGFVGRASVADPESV